GVSTKEISMKAIVYSRYDSPDVLHCEEREKPAPKDDEVLITVRGASVNPSDWHFMRGTPYSTRGRRSGDFRGTHRQVVRIGGDRRMQHEERRSGPVHRRRSRH